MNEQIRAFFPITKRLVYLNHAAMSPPPVTAIAAAYEQLCDVQLNGFQNFGVWQTLKEETRRRLAEMLGARPEQIAFLRNTSDALSWVAQGLPWQPGDNVVTYCREFPSNIHPWLNLRRLGVELRLAADHDGRVDVNDLLSLIDDRTRVVALSFVQFASGFRADLERIGRAARSRDALLVADVIQGVGVAPLDVEAQLVDAAAGAGYKWLMAPEGVGYLYLSDRARERLNPTLTGWQSVDEPEDWENFTQDWKPGAGAWETGTFGHALLYSLNQSLALLQETGVTRIAAHLAELSDYLCDKLAGTDYRIVSSRCVGEKSQIICIRHCNPAVWPAAVLCQHLQALGIAVSARSDRLRIAPHFYNLFSDIDALVEALPRKKLAFGVKTA